MPENMDKQDGAGKQITVSRQLVKAAMYWLTWADKDYLAARQLLLGDCIVQAAGLANTAIEKYLKAVLAITCQKVPRTHDPLGIYQGIKSKSKFQLDEDFLALLVKAYKLRYPDDLKAGFNIVLNQALILCALDDSVNRINACFTLKKSDGTPAARILDHLIASNDPRILTKNIALHKITKEALFNSPSRVYEMRALTNQNYLEVEYVTARTDDPNFNKEAFV